MQKAESIALPPEAPHGLEITRDVHGVPHIVANELGSLLWGLGYCHALDRGLQLLLTRILGEGRASECLAATPEMLEVDRFFRRLNWRGNAATEALKLSAQSTERLQSYTAGINARLRESVPWEFRLVGYVPQPWIAADTILLSRVIGYVGLAQSQGELERLFVEMVQAGVDDARLAALFPNIAELQALAGQDPLLASRELLQRVRLGQRVVPDGVRWMCPVPRVTSSNSWAIGPSKTLSGFAQLANDPHLDVNRLPNVWYEIVARVRNIPGHYVLAATMPGLPAALLGRTATLSWGATYSFLDAVDSWIEECRGGLYRRGDEFVPFACRRELIKRKKQAPVELKFFENEHGVLDGDPAQDGYLLSTRWASAESGARSIEATFAMWTASDVDQGMTELGQIETAWNWLLADRAGNIGFQMSGLMPKRRPGVSGFVPLPGWHSQNDWQGFVPASEMPREKNPACGFLVTANQDLNRFSKLQPQNATMADYRADRITQLLENRTDLSVADSKSIQYDTYSPQAALFMQRLGPMLPDNESGRLLREWDYGYDRQSRGATLFERFYAALTHLIVGRYILGPEVIAHLTNSTAILSTFFKNIEPLLLEPPSELCDGRSPRDLYLEAFSEASKGPILPWSTETQTLLTHLFFGGRLPRWTGFDRGPISLAGGRASVCQAQLYEASGRSGCLAATLRLIADMGEDALHTNLIGGPSDRRFSRWYCSGLAGWLDGTFKALRADATRAQ
jgi:penicillin amidase